MQLEDELCLCFHVTKRKILNYIRIHQPRRVSQLSNCGGAGTGCGWCVPYLKKYFTDAQQGEIPPGDELSLDEYAQGRRDYIQAGKGTPPSEAEPK